MRFSFALAAVLAICVALFSSAAQAGSTGRLLATDLRCNRLTAPLSIVDPAPELSWITSADRRAERSTAYRILIASTPEKLAAENADLWDSGVVKGDSMSARFGGPEPRPGARVHWKVRVWDRDGVPGPWSEPAFWEVGPRTRDDWTASWIDATPTPSPVQIVEAWYVATNGSARRDVTSHVAATLAQGKHVVASNAALGGDPAKDVPKRLEITYRVAGVTLRTEAAENSTAVLAGPRLPYLRSTFEIGKPVTRARLHISALGVYEPYLNGRRVGDDHLAPGWTDYRKRVQYQTFDVTDQLAVGRNCLGAIVGPGWFCGRAGLFHAREFYGRQPALIAQLDIAFADGSSQRIVSDGSWRRADGPILAADIMDGAICDARLAITDWNGADLDDRVWSAVTLREESRTLEPQPDQPVEAIAEIPAKSLTEPLPGRWTFDLGQNIVGVVRLRTNAAPGTVLTLRHAEMLKPDGSIYTDNLRGAAATDTYICKGGGEVWIPPFTFHGFRYVELTGLETRPDLDAIAGVVLGTALPEVGEFTCSDDRLNQLQSNIRWGLRGNYLSIPTDCPQRDERMGWMADTQVFATTAAYNADVGPFMHKWMLDVLDSQREDGAHSDVAPVMKGLTYGTPAWADAGTIVPWTMYQMQGDRRILERHIDSMVRWVEWCRANSTALIRDKARGNDYGDWLSIKADTPKDLIGTAYFARSADIVAQSLAVLGRESEAATYRKLFEDIRAAFVAKYIDPEGRVHGDTQTGYLLALRFNLMPHALRDMAMKRLIADVASKGWRVSTGFVGVALMLPTLDDAGRVDEAYRLLLQDEFPSWLFSVKHGATTIWERWDGWTPERGVHPDASMNSFNHYALGSAGEWLFAGVGGIQPMKPGFAEVLIRPRMAGPLTWANADYRSVRGTISSRWKRENDRVSLNITIPANTTATVVLPTRRESEILESGSPVERAEGVRVLERGADSTTMRVGSGEYRFVATLPPKRSGNPILPGRYADPEVGVFAGKYWIFPTYSAPYDKQTFLDAFSSLDLVNWTRHERVLQTSSVPWATRAMWAPSVVENNGKFFLFFGANDIQRNGELGGIGVAVADSPAGPYTDYLGKPLIDAFHNGAQPIDQFAFKAPDGQWYLIYGGWRHCNITRLSPDFKSLQPFEDGETFKEITPEGYVEGPFMFVRNGKYYFMWSEGGWTGPDYSVAYAIAESPMGPFQRVGKILQQDPLIATGAGHHSVLTLPNSDEHYIVYHRRPLGETGGNQRVVCIDRLQFDDQDRILPVVMTFEGVEPRPLSQSSR